MYKDIKILYIIIKKNINMDKIIKNNLFDGNELLKGNNTYSDIDLIDFREKYLEKYSKEKGWDKYKLTSEQLLEIVNTPGYKSPGLIKS